VEVPILGIVENMATFICPHCGERSDIFGHGGARREAERLDVPSDEYPPGYVVAQRPRAGSRLASGRTVVIEVANGQAASSAVPSVLGLAEAEAVEALRRAGFTADVAPEAEPPAAGVDGRAGQVWKQSPAGGVRRVPGTSVRISVNPAPPAPPPRPRSATGRR